jgi:hypothetical protein
MTGAVAVGVSGDAVVAACFAALSCVLVAPANAYRKALLAGVPTAVTVLVGLPLDLDPAATLVWMTLGGLWGVLLMSRLRVAKSDTGVPAVTAWLHAVVMAAAVALIVYVVTRYDVPHGYWVAMTMTIVLRPIGTETRALSAQRIAGTVLGVIVALLAAALLPGWALALTVVGLLIAVTGYAMLHKYGQQVTMLTPLVIIVASGGVGEAALTLAVERVAATLLGVLIAAGLAVGLRWLDERA